MGSWFLNAGFLGWGAAVVEHAPHVLAVLAALARLRSPHVDAAVTVHKHLDQRSRLFGAGHNEGGDRVEDHTNHRENKILK